MSEEPELEAVGVWSAVGRGYDNDHVLAIDYDDYEPSERLLEKIDGLPGLTLMVESSPGSHHYHNLTMRSLDETALMLMELKSDPMRTMMGYTWRPPRWVTRIGAKFEAESKDLVKDPPKLTAIQYNPTVQPQSAGHYDVIASHVKGDFPDRGDMPADIDWSETSPNVEKYKALSERQK